MHRLGNIVVIALAIHAKFALGASYSILAAGRVITKALRKARGEKITQYRDHNNKQYHEYN